LLRHNLDVLHIEKNFLDNVFNTVMNIKNKTKDNQKVRMDVVELCPWRLGVGSITKWKVSKVKGQLHILKERC